MLRDGNYSETNKAALLNIALQCPHTKGNIIYSARSLFNMSFPESYQVFQDNCDGTGGLYKKDATVPNNNQPFEALVYPNPTDNLIFIKTNLSADEAIDIEVIDITGKSILKQTCKTNISMCSVQLAPNVAGIYFIKIKNTKNETVTSKVLLE